MRPPERNEELTLTIDGLGSEGQGIGRHEGFAVFVPFALPGERVRAHVVKPGKSYAVAKLIDIIEKSPERAEPVCPVFGRCGGCELMHFSYPAQLEFKRGEVENALRRIGGFKDVSANPVIGMDEPLRYRNKASFPFAVVDGKARFGFYAPRSHRLIPLDDCPIQQKPLVDCAKAVRKWANVCGVSVYNEETGFGALRHAVARGNKAGEVMVAVVTNGALPHREELIRMLREGVPGLASIVHNRNDQNTNVIFGARFETVWGKERLEETVRGLSFDVSAASFLQVNPEQTEKLYREVEALLPGESGNVIDVFCGTGTITLLAARKAEQAVGIECVREAVEDAVRNAAKNNVTNARFVCGDAAEVLPKLVSADFSPDVVILDPPRKGCDPAVLEALVASGAKRLIYVSCDPATLARDCKRLREGGYELKSVQPVDMFPQTAHVECVVLMSREED
ncbi:MAG TPA: 23S rRNA (uracil(1939)-C(5))-methyltransferase RlmD [Clostridia bacterium]|nr:23S rRNA (uracil(1939)-C(5))-methyltransferase RlmD [Clostridia bacterium]